MLFNEDNNAHNRFKPFLLPTARKLFERFGFSMIKNEHPDCTDPYKFSEPSNPHDSLAFHSNMALGKSIASEAYSEVSAKSAKSVEPAEPAESSKKDDLPE